MIHPIKSVMQLGLIACISFLFSSCSSGGGETGDSAKALDIRIDTLAIQLDINSSGNNHSFQYLDWGTPTLAWFDKVTHSIELYSLENPSLQKRIKLQKEGPDGVGTGNLGMYFITPDSIVISNQITLYLVNSSGKVINKYRPELEALGGRPDFDIAAHKPVVRNGDQLFVSVFPQKDAFKQEDLRSWRSIVKLNLKDGKVEALGNLPPFMQENILGFNYTDKSFAGNGTHLIVSYSGDKALYEIPFDQPEQMATLAVETGDFDNPKPMPTQSKNDMMGNFRHFAFNDSFDALFFNGSHYMRICQSPITEDEYKDRSWSKEKTLFFYNADFELVHEFPLNSKYGNYLMTTAIPNGFLLKVKSDDEDVLNFMRVTIEAGS